MKIKVYSIFVFCISILSGINCYAQNDSLYSFIVAGHAYGAHSGENKGLHPPLLKKLSQNVDSTIQHIFLTGDIVNYSTTESWQQVENELSSFDMDSYYVMGNHDNNSVGRAIFQQKHGGAYYSFPYKNELFIVLNSTESDRSISETQLLFLENVLNNATPNQDRIFIFFHEVIWNSVEKYRLVRSNSRSRYDLVKDHSNFWEDVFPMLTVFSEKEFYLFAGDVGGNPDAIAASYDKWENVSLLTSGMGEVTDENYLRVDVLPDTVVFSLVPLNDDIEMHPITWYNIPEAPKEIEGPDKISSPENNVAYHVDPVFNATNYRWQLSSGLSGKSDSSTILVDFESFFKSGTISVSAENDGFGVSESVNLNIETDWQTASFNTHFETNFRVHQNGESVHIIFNSHKNSSGLLNVYNTTGALLYFDEVIVDQGINRIKIGKKHLETGVLIFKVSIGNESYHEKIFINF